MCPERNDPGALFQMALFCHEEINTLGMEIPVKYLLQAMKQAHARTHSDNLLANIENLLAYIYCQANTNLPIATQLANSAVRKEPKNPSFLDTLGGIYTKRNLLDRACKVFKQVIKSKDSEILNNAANAYYLAKKYKKALNLWLKAKKNYTSDKYPSQLEREINEGIEKLNSKGIKISFWKRISKYL